MSYPNLGASRDRREGGFSISARAQDREPAESEAETHRKPPTASDQKLTQREISDELGRRAMELWQQGTYTLCLRRGPNEGGDATG